MQHGDAFHAASMQSCSGSCRPPDNEVENRIGGLSSLQRADRARVHGECQVFTGLTQKHNAGPTSQDKEESERGAQYRGTLQEGNRLEQEGRLLRNPLASIAIEAGGTITIAGRKPLACEA